MPSSQMTTALTIEDRKHWFAVGSANVPDQSLGSHGNLVRMSVFYRTRRAPKSPGKVGA